MSKMGLHDPFGHLKHKLWPKERSGVKLSIWLFDSWPLKVGNRHGFLTCKWCVTYHWKALDMGDNFDLDITSIGGLHTKLWASKIAKVPILGILGLQLGSPMTKWHLDASFVAKHRDGGRWWLPPNLGRGQSCESMFARGSSMH